MTLDFECRLENVNPSLERYSVNAIEAVIFISFLCTLFLHYTTVGHADDQVQVSSHELELTTLKEVEVIASRPLRLANAGALGSPSRLELPFSVSTRNTAALDRCTTSTTAELFFNDPAVVAEMNPHSSGRLSPINVRGIELDWRNYRLNGIPVDSWGFEWSLELMEQVELLKGATGFMYGFGTPGGIVNYVTKKPLPSSQLSTEAGWQSDSIFSGALDINQRMGAKGEFGYRINLAHEEGTAPGGAEVERTAFSLAVEAQLNDHLKAAGEFIYLERKLSNESLEYGFDGFAFRAPPDPIKGSEDRSIDETYWNTEYVFSSLKLDYEINDQWSSSLLYSYAYKEASRKKPYAEIFNTAGDYQLFNYQLDGEIHRHYLQWLTEGNWQTGPLLHHVTFGASWQEAKTNSSPESYDSLGIGNLYTGHDGILPFTAHISDYSFLNELRQGALFLSNRIELTQGLSLLAGIRYNDYSQNTPAYVYDRSVFTPTLALMHKLGKGSMIYASYVESLEQGGVVPVVTGGLAYSNAGDFLPPLESRQYEIGLKVEKDKWQANVALFRFERTAEIDRHDSPTSRTRVQDGETVYQGIEASTSLQLTEQFRLTLGAMILDATYDKVSDSASSIQGNRVAGASDFQGVMEGFWKIPFFLGLELHAGLRFHGDFFWQDTNLTKFPSYLVINTGLGYTAHLSDRPLHIRLDITNVSDEVYWSNAGVSPAPAVKLAIRREW